VILSSATRLRAVWQASVVQRLPKLCPLLNAMPSHTVREVFHIALTIHQREPSLNNWRLFVPRSKGAPFCDSPSRKTKKKLSAMREGFVVGGYLPLFADGAWEVTSNLALPLYLHSVVGWRERQRIRTRILQVLAAKRRAERAFSTVRSFPCVGLGCSPAILTFLSQSGCKWRRCGPFWLP
jgi:hypothetical protein